MVLTLREPFPVSLLYYGPVGYIWLELDINHLNGEKVLFFSPLGIANHKANNCPATNITNITLKVIIFIVLDSC